MFWQKFRFGRTLPLKYPDSRRHLQREQQQQLLLFLGEGDRDPPAAAVEGGQGRRGAHKLINSPIIHKFTNYHSLIHH